MSRRMQTQLKASFEIPAQKQETEAVNSNDPCAPKPVIYKMAQEYKTAQEQFAIQSAMLAKMDMPAATAPVVQESAEEVETATADTRLSIQIGHITMTHMGQQKQAGGLLFTGPSQK